MKIKTEWKDRNGRLNIVVSDVGDLTQPEYDELVEEEQKHGRTVHNHGDSRPRNKRGSG